MSESTDKSSDVSGSPSVKIGSFYFEDVNRKGSVVSLLPLCFWSEIISAPPRASPAVSSVVLFKKTARGARAGPVVLLFLLLLLRVVCGTSEAVASFHHQGEGEEEARKRERTTAASAVSWRIGPYGLLRTGGRNQKFIGTFLKRKTQSGFIQETPRTDLPGRRVSGT